MAREKVRIVKEKDGTVVEFRDWSPSCPYSQDLGIGMTAYLADGSTVTRQGAKRVKWTTPPDWRERLTAAIGV